MTASRSTRPGIRGAVVAILAVAALAIAPLPAPLVERYFSRGIYPQVQRVLTSLSNLTPVALLDVAVLALLLILIVSVLRAARAAGWRRAGVRAVIFLLKTTAAIYVLFVLLWGLNYRRVPLEEKLDFNRESVTHARAAALASEAVRRANATYAAAHATSFEPVGLATAFGAAERTLGAKRDTVTGRPKRSILGVYFRAAAVDGMTDPIFLEVILNPDLLVVERPEVLAHEWAHLAGYADESEANFLAWLTCLRGDALARYSGWLSAYTRATRVLPRPVRDALPRLDAGPRGDLQAITARYERSSRVVRRAAQGAYDSYLKANRIEEGIANYDAVLQLMLGTSLGADWDLLLPRR